MIKEKYIKDLTSLLKEPSTNKQKFDSLYTLMMVDESLTKEDRQEIVTKMLFTIVDVIKDCGEQIISDPLTTSEDIDYYNDSISGLIDDISNNKLKPSTKHLMN
jgi:hypothetical protein